MNNKPYTVHFNTIEKKRIMRYGTLSGALRAIKKHCHIDFKNNCSLLHRGESNFYDHRNIDE